MSDILTQIIAHKRTEVAQAKAQKSLATLEAEAAKAPAARDFFGSLSRTDSARIIAECKTMSKTMTPSLSPRHTNEAAPPPSRF
jgi:indole-3-glycerol phosphate synthase